MTGQAFATAKVEKLELVEAAAREAEWLGSIRIGCEHVVLGAAGVLSEREACLADALIPGEARLPEPRSRTAVILVSGLPGSGEQGGGGARSKARHTGLRPRLDARSLESVRTGET